MAINNEISDTLARSFTLYRSDVQMNIQNLFYPIKEEINSLDDLHRVCGYDHIMAEMENHDRRVKKNFKCSNVLILDFDNDEKRCPTPGDYVTIDYIKSLGIECWVHSSKSHTDDKHKLHLYLPTNRTIYDYREWEKYQKKLVEMFDKSDKAIKNCNRLFFTSKTDEYWCQRGRNIIGILDEEFMKDKVIDQQKKKEQNRERSIRKNNLQKWSIDNNWKVDISNIHDSLVIIAAKLGQRGYDSDEILNELEKRNQNESLNRPFDELERIAMWGADREVRIDERKAYEKLDSRYIVSAVGGKFRIYDWPSRSFFTKQDFLDIENNHKIKFIDEDTDEEVVIDCARTWIDKSKRYRKIDCVFDLETELPDDTFNSFRGYNTTPREGECDLILDHIKTIICNRDESMYEWFMGWLAFMFQQPTKKIPSVPVLISDEGTGKSTITDMLIDIIGTIHSTMISDIDTITQNHNAELQEKLLVVFEESTYGGSQKTKGMLKAFTGNKTVRIEPKFMEAYNITNCLHFIIASNEDWAAPVGENNRRYVIMQVSDERRNDTKYFEALNHCIDSGGKEAFLHELLNWDLSDYNAYKIPHTEAEERMKTHGRKLHEEWIRSCIDHELPPAYDLFSKVKEGRITSTEAYKIYLEYYNTYSSKYDTKLRPSQLKILLEKYGITHSKSIRFGGVVTSGYIVPSIAEIRKNMKSAPMNDLDEQSVVIASGIEYDNILAFSLDSIDEGSSECSNY